MTDDGGQWVTVVEAAVAVGAQGRMREQGQR